MAGLHAINAQPRIFAGCYRHSNHLTSTFPCYPFHPFRFLVLTFTSLSSLRAIFLLQGAPDLRLAAPPD
jgi:hypothetical protein